MACKCQRCSLPYKVDLVIPDELWARIRPVGKSPKSGLLCGRCIIDSIEALDEYSAFEMSPA
jgi:hypothetical protein